MPSLIWGTAEDRQALLIWLAHASLRRTVPNLAMVQGGNGKVSFYNQSGGQLQLVVHEFGYFMVAS